jgi:transposase-like protein
MTVVDKKLDRDERRRAQRAGVEALESSGALDELYSMIDAGEVQLDGKDGLIQQLIKAGLERGLHAELSDRLGYEKGDPEAGLYGNSRNGSYPKIVATSVGDVELAIPRDRDATFTPTLVPKGSRRVGGLDDMIVSLYAGRMTVRDIEHHLASTIGTEISRETISKITDEVLDEVLVWQRRPLESGQFLTIVANPGRMGLQCLATR